MWCLSRVEAPSLPLSLPELRPVELRRARRELGSSRPFAFTQFVLLDLPGRGFRELAELHLARHLEARQCLAREGEQLVRGDRGSGSERHERLWPLAPLLVGDRDHRGLEYVAVANECALDLDRRDVL